MDTLSKVLAACEKNPPQKEAVMRSFDAFCWWYTEKKPEQTAV